ncbi:cupin domain-containing protein [Flavobacterium sp.]|uniref:cupin domain-containing protein n=1 Tax=Flavobacterium sp. TaxID=239 RepID=UPI002CE14DC5|nr:cupin domain-containing protein [Flavobacterium sp.]HSD05967.1 cupin domain-containing protein [Flavobacterium sp.]
MKRKSFLQACFSSIALMSVPFDIIAKSSLNFREKKGFKVDAGKARFDKSLPIFEGDTFDGKVSTIDTDGDMYIFESVRTKEGGPAHHYHFSQDEWWYVLQGQFLIKIGDTTFEAKAGDSVFGPRMVPHSFAKIGEGEGKLLMVFQPAGKMEECFQKISSGAVSKLTEEERDKFCIEHGFKRVGPPIKNQQKW